MSPGSAKYMRPCLRGKVVRQHSGKMRREFLVPLSPPLLPIIEHAVYGSISQILFYEGPYHFRAVFSLTYLDMNGCSP